MVFDCRERRQLEDISRTPGSWLLGVFEVPFRWSWADFHKSKQSAFCRVHDPVGDRVQQRIHITTGDMPEKELFHQSHCPMINVQLTAAQ